jgi:hypothetical protein
MVVGVETVMGEDAPAMVVNANCFPVVELVTVLPYKYVTDDPESTQKEYGRLLYALLLVFTVSTVPVEEESSPV